jgi:hypothetical protein
MISTLGAETEFKRPPFVVFEFFGILIRDYTTTGARFSGGNAICIRW